MSSGSQNSKEGRIAELEARLNKTPQDSSLAPSTQHPHARPKPRPKPSGRKPGGVIWRKLSFGTQSAASSRFVETMLSVIETCRQQDRPVLEFVTRAVTAHFADQPKPSLLRGA